MMAKEVLYVGLGVRVIVDEEMQMLAIIQFGLGFFFLLFKYTVSVSGTGLSSILFVLGFFIRQVWKSC